MKICTVCKKSLELTSFGKDSSLKSGLTSQCKPCRKARKDAWAEANRIKTHEYAKQYRVDNKEKVREYNKSYYKTYYEENSDKLKEYQQQYKVANSGKVNALCAKRRAKKLLATPDWVLNDPIELLKIEGLYIEARNLAESTGIPHDVDHIIPLQGLYISGFHCYSNLQVITSEANAKKSNKHESDSNFDKVTTI